MRDLAVLRQRCVSISKESIFARGSKLRSGGVTCFESVLRKLALPSGDLVAERADVNGLTVAISWIRQMSTVCV